MNDAVTIDSTAVRSEPYKVDVSRGQMNSRLSSQWFSRPDDQRFMDLRSLHEATLKSAGASDSHVVDVRDVRVMADKENPEVLDLILPSKQSGGEDVRSKPTHWSFGQVCGLVKTPAWYLRTLPGTIAGINLQYGLQSFRSEGVKAYYGTDGAAELRAATGPDYGRIYDHEVVAAVRKIAGNGDGSDGYPWKIPGVMDWRTGTYNPNAPITRQSTTLFASDRDVFLFLCDDQHPIEIGTLADGSPDLVFRGFMVWNSEVGAKSVGIACFYLRGVCMNRCLWGVEGYEELTFRHSKFAPQRFMQEAAPTLKQFTENSTAAFLQGVKSAKETVVARNDEERKKFLKGKKFTDREARAILSAVVENSEVTEGTERPAENIWDFVQGITAVAKEKTHQDERVAFERRAKGLLNKVA